MGRDIPFGRYHALVIGNNDYAQLRQLHTAVSDAIAVGDVLREKYGFEVTTLLNATRARLITELNRLRATLTEKDNLLVYYAGHGNLDGDVGYWLPVDAAPNNEANWLALSTLTRNLRSMTAKHVMVIADSCYSSTLVRSVETQLATGQERLAWLQRMVSRRSRTALTSGGLEPVVDGGGGGDHSVFAKALLNLLSSNDDVLSGEDVFQGVRGPVVLNADQTPTYADIRLAGHDGGEFLFVPRGWSGEYKLRAGQSTAQAPPGRTNPSIELTFWNAIKDSEDPEMFEAFLTQFPNGNLAPLAHVMAERYRRMPKSASRSAPAYQLSAPERPEWMPSRGPDLEEVELPYEAIVTANVREQPTAKSRRVGRLEPGEAVLVTGKLRNTNWYRVAVDEGRVGFVFGDLLAPRMSGEVPAPAAPRADAAPAASAGTAQQVRETAMREARRLAEEMQKNAAAEARRVAEEIRERAAAEAAKATEEARKRAEAEAQTLARQVREDALAAARKLAEAEAKTIIQEGQAQAKAEAQKLVAAEARRLRAETLKRAEAHAREIAEQLRLKAEADARRAAEVEARSIIEESRKQAAQEAQRLAEESRNQAEASARKLAEELRGKAEADARRLAEAEARRIVEQSRKQAEAEVRAIAAESRKKAEAEARSIIAESRVAAEAEAKRMAEGYRAQIESQARRLAEAEALKVAEAIRKRAEAESRAMAETNRGKAEAKAREVAESILARAEQEAKKIAEDIRLKAETSQRAAAAEARQEVEARRKRAEAEAQSAAADIRAKAEAEATRVAEEIRRKAEAAAAKFSAQRREKAAADAHRVATEIRSQAVEEARRLAEAEAQRIAEASRARVEADARKINEDNRKKAEADAVRVAAEIRRKAEAEAHRQAAAEARRIAEESRKNAETEAQRIIEESRRKAEAEAGRIAEDSRRRAEAEAQKAADAELRRIAEQSRRRAAAEAEKILAESRKKSEAEASRIAKADRRDVAAAAPQVAAAPVRKAEVEMAAADEERHGQAGVSVPLPAHRPAMPRETASRVAALDTGPVRALAGAASKGIDVKPMQTFRDCPGCPEMVALPQGSFVMGAPHGDPSAHPTRRVSIAAPFAIGRLEVSIAEWDACVKAGACKAAPSYSKETAGSGGRVRGVSWNDANRYVAWLSKLTGRHYRLPTEAEWEYAARGGTRTRYWWGDEIGVGRADCRGCGNKAWNYHTLPAGGRHPANPFGLYDMNGGVAEWVADCWHNSYRGAPADGRAWTGDNCLTRTLRGGSWRNEPEYLTSASRFKYDADVRYSTNGFRVARDLMPESTVAEITGLAAKGEDPVRQVATIATTDTGRPDGEARQISDDIRRRAEEKAKEAPEQRRDRTKMGAQAHPKAEGAERQQAAAPAVPIPTPRPARPSKPADRVAALEAGAVQASSGAASRSAPVKAIRTFRDCPDCPEMAVLPAGAFIMGSRDNDPTARPARPVSIAKPFAIGRLEVSLAEWNVCVKAGACKAVPGLSDEAAMEGARLRDVSWNDARRYVAWLSKLTGHRYRLPTEAEWEYAARGGKQTRYWWGDEIGSGRADCRGCGNKPWNYHAPPAGGRHPANPFGLYDMNGGVAEWVADCWHNSYEGAPADGRAWTSDTCLTRTLRGGSWRNEPKYLTSASRFKYDADVRYSTNGFRVARDMDD